MAIKFREIPVGTITFDENDTKRIKIPRVNAIRRIMCRFFVKTVEDDTADPTENEDTILNIIKKARLVFDGDDNKFNVDVRKKFYMEKLEKGTEPPTNKDDDQGQDSTKTWYVFLVFDFATNPKDETDTTALLPARKFSKLDLEMDYGAVADIFSAQASGVTITDADSGVEVEIRECIDTENKVAFAKGQAGEGFLDVRESVFSVDVDAEHTNFEDDALEKDIKPAPNLILKHLLLFLDENADKTNSLSATDVLVTDTRGAGETIIKRDLVMLNYEMKTEYGIESLDDGVVLLDWIDKLGGGLRNTDTEGALKFKFKTPSPSGTPTIKGLTRYVAGRTKAKPANV